MMCVCVCINIYIHWYDSDNNKETCRKKKDECPFISHLRSPPPLAYMKEGREREKRGGNHVGRVNQFLNSVPLLPVRK